MDVAVVLVALPLAALIGFAAHRASICSVKAVEEVLTTRRGYIVLSFAKTVLWVMGATLAIGLLFPGALEVPGGWRLSAASVLGGFVFGVGATINRGCAFSTLTRLGGGDLGMVVSLVGLMAGAAALSIAQRGGVLPGHAADGALLSMGGSWITALGAALGLWALWELVRLFRTRRPAERWANRLAAPRYRLSTAAALMGLSNGILYALFGVWAYTWLLSQWARSIVGPGAAPPWPFWALFAAAVLGVVVSAVHGGRVRLDWRPTRAWLRYAAGGGLMGVGAGLIPGGNDVLILHTIPALSDHGIPAFAAMVLGIAATLSVNRLLGGQTERIDCAGDLCST